MKQIINDLLYDTEKSTLIYTEKDTKRRLFQTPNNHFFMCYISGEIVPKSESETKDYLGERDIDKYIEIFGEPKEA